MKVSDGGLRRIKTQTWRRKIDVGYERLGEERYCPTRYISTGSNLCHSGPWAPVWCVPKGDCDVPLSGTTNIYASGRRGDVSVDAQNKCARGPIGIDVPVF